MLLRTMMRSLIVAALVAAVPAPGLLTQNSAAQRASAPAIDCAMASVPAELNYCADVRLKQADVELRTALTRAAARIGRFDTAKPDDRAKWKDALDASQRAWSSFRESDCKGVVPYEWQGGTGTTLAVLECMAQMTEQRVFDVNERYSESR